MCEYFFIRYISLPLFRLNSEPDIPSLAIGKSSSMHLRRVTSHQSIPKMKRAMIFTTAHRPTYLQYKHILKYVCGLHGASSIEHLFYIFTFGLLY